MGIVDRIRERSGSVRRGGRSGERGSGREPIRDAPRAQRLRVRRRGDLRLWLGLALVVGSMFAGAHLMSRGAQTVTVWQAERDMSVGSAPQHLRPVTLALGSVAEDYVLATERPAGQLRYPIQAGELIPRSALTLADSSPSRIVTIGVDPLHAPIDLVSGDRVDVWTTPDPVDSLTVPGDVGTADGPRLVLESVPVEAVAPDAMGRELAIVVRVRPDQVEDLVAAARAGVIDLVAVPAHSQELSS